MLITKIPAIYAILLYNNFFNMQPDNSDKLPNIMTSKLTNISSIKLALSLDSILGVENHERSKPQEIRLNLITYFEITHLKDEQLEADLKLLIHNTLAQNQPFLLERLAHTLALEIMNSFQAMRSLTLTIEKPSALENAKNAHVTIRAQSNSARLLAETIEPLKLQ